MVTRRVSRSTARPTRSVAAWAAALALMGGLAACSDEAPATGPTTDVDEDTTGVDDADAGPVADAPKPPDTIVPDVEADADATPDAVPDVDAVPMPDADADAPPVEDADADADAPPVEDADVPVEPDVPVGECPPEVDCDDGLACTVDSCVMPGALCSWEVVAGQCLINNVCRADGEAKPGAPCLVCQPDVDPFVWTPLADAAACDDGDACTEGEACVEGACAGGVAITCDDGDVCTVDGCDQATGCTSAAAEDGTACDDGDACTVDDVCIAGACGGTPADCDDGNPCTDGLCDGETGSCVQTNNSAACEDGDPCTAGDVCVDGACVTGDDETSCDDGNICTYDLCDPVVGCAYLPVQHPCCVGDTSKCDDGDPCTNDLCDAAGECAYEPNTAACDDGDACTEGDTCADLVCSCTPITCADEYPCTDDACDTSLGCTFTPASGASCDDGIECTTDDACQDGVCVGDASGCVCTPTFSDDVVKLTSIAIGDGGLPGEGLDVDLDATTCAPASGCEGGIDNNLGMLAALINEPLGETVADGSVILLMELKDVGGAAPLAAIYQGDLDATNPSCAVQTDPCVYTVDGSMLDADTCQPTVALPATIDGAQIVAGGPDTVFPFSIPLGDAVLEVVINKVRFEGTLTFEFDGDQLTALSGILGGAVPKEDLMAAIDAVPDDSLPFPKDTIKGLLETLVENDIDTTGDGLKDAASIGIKVTGIGASISGLAP